MFLYPKSNVKIDELTSLSTPKLLYVCETDIVESCMTYRFAHSHEFLEVLYIFEGTGLIDISGKEYSISHGDLIVYNAEVLHDEKPNTSKMGITSIGVSHLCLPQLPPNCLLPRNTVPVIHCDHHMASFVEGLFSELVTIMSDSSKDDAVICNYMMLLILSIARSFGKKTPENTKSNNTRSSEICEQIKNYIQKHYTKSLSNESISNAVSISPYHMSRIFKKQTGCTPMQYVTQLRLGKAQTLLVHTDMPITQIAYTVGYNSSSSFNYSFLKLLGLTPGTYRKLYRP